MDSRRWMTAVRQILLPELGEPWFAAGPSVVHGPVGWTSRQVDVRPIRAGRGFVLEAKVKLLALPDPHGYSCGLRLGQATGALLTEPPAVDGYRPVLAHVAGLLRDEAQPLFDRYGHVDGYLEHLTERAADLADRGGEWIDLRLDEELCYVHLIRGDLAAAGTGAEWAERAAAAEASDAGWAAAAVSRVREVMAAARQDRQRALGLLAANAAGTAAALGLPAPRL